MKTLVLIGLLTLGSLAQEPSKLYSLDDVLNRESVLESYDARMGDALERNGFVIVEPGRDSMRWRHFHDLYEQLRYDDEPAFITTDVALHYAHEVVDYTMEELESTSLTKALGLMLLDLIEATRAQGAEAQPNLVYLSVAYKLLNPHWAPAPQVAKAVNGQVALINAGGKDYDQYKPRGRYTKSAALKNYFRAMMWVGRTSFDPKDKRKLRQALLLSKALTGSPRAMKSYQGLQRVIGYLVGPSDDPGPLDYAPLLKLSLDEAQQRALELKGRIADSSRGMRLLGQAFVPDSYMFTQLTDPAVPGRSMVSGLDVMAVLGSGAARQMQTTAEAGRFASYPDQLAKVTAEFKQLPAATWSQNLYWTWLDAFRALLGPRQNGQPPCMLTAAWERKALNTALGSWTELRHDTILYAKPGYAEGGEGRHFMAMQLAKGYVEPEPEVYQRIQSMCRKTRVALQTEGLMTPRVAKVLGMYESITGRMLEISRKELAGKPLTLEDYNFIREFGRAAETLHELVRNDQVSSDGGRGSKYDSTSCALVADVHTDAAAGVCLEEGVGFPLEIVAIVPVDGQNVMVRGLVYTHYEFTQPSSNRLSDAEWEQMLTDRKAPPLAAWMQNLIGLLDREATYPIRAKALPPREMPAGTRAGDLRVSSVKSVSWGVGDQRPRYSPDGQFLLFTRKGRVWVTCQDGTGQIPLTPASLQAAEPNWMPLECKVIFTAGSKMLLYDYAVHEYESGNERAIYPYAHTSTDLGSGSQPAGLRKGQGLKIEERVIFCRDGKLMSLDPGTTDKSKQHYPKSDRVQVRGVSEMLGGSNSDPDVTWDGQRVAFTSGGFLHVLEVGKSTPRKLVEGGSPAWSPDGSMLVYVKDQNLWVVNADGTQPTQLTRDGAASSPTWGSPFRIACATRKGLAVLTLAAGK